MKRFSCVVLCLFSAYFLSAQLSSIRLGVLKGISCAPCAYLIENKAKLSVQNMNFQIFDSERTELPKLLRGELDVGFLAPKDAAKVFKTTGGSIVMLASVQNGNLFLLTNDENYRSFEDLKGETLICAENDIEETTVFKHILSEKEITIGDDEKSVKIDFSVPQANIANSLILGKTKYALVREPFATIALNTSSVRRVENIQKTYSSVEEGSSFPVLLLVARTDFVKEKSDLLKRFLEEYRKALLWTTKNPSNAAFLIEKHDFGLSSSVAGKSIPNASLTFRESNAVKSDLEKLYGLLGVENPTDEFYFRK
ncbi:ABC transporter substrate-binding protein [uncultured Treponema sp.]|uniref:ABC transporter substrate-binding protein n=1 Tax=uncultured Treponema sp. TaxID=162155 RepID=UPI0025CFCFB4|nr:ABC transporter substrate-binding protein [uncultured Treponema sp.]